jgi:hypothetical protein
MSSPLRRMRRCRGDQKVAVVGPCVHPDDGREHPELVQLLKHRGLCNATAQCPFCDSEASIPAPRKGEMTRGQIAHDRGCPLMHDKLRTIVLDAPAAVSGSTTRSTKSSCPGTCRVGDEVAGPARRPGRASRSRHLRAAGPGTGALPTRPKVDPAGSAGARRGREAARVVVGVLLAVGDATLRHRRAPRVGALAERA